jgi:hypothetical protein
VAGGKEGLSRQQASTGYLQNGTGPELRVVEVFILRKAASKQAGSAEADLAVGCSGLQYIMSAQLWS